jgi:hypothetical protein
MIANVLVVLALWLVFCVATVVICARLLAGRAARRRGRRGDHHGMSS